jgi:hypothetical protein
MIVDLNRNVLYFILLIDIIPRDFDHDPAVTLPCFYRYEPATNNRRFSVKERRGQPQNDALHQAVINGNLLKDI